MASVALAVGLRAVFGQFDPTWLAKSVATIFIVLALYIFWAAERSAAQTLARLSDNDAHAQPLTRMRIIVAALALGAVSVGGVLWAL